MSEEQEENPEENEISFHISPMLSGNMGICDQFFEKCKPISYNSIAD